jgi:hypothetical protein
MDRDDLAHPRAVACGRYTPSMRRHFAIQSGVLVGAVLLTLSSCGGRTIEPESICVRARILPIDPVMVTRTGRVLEPQFDGWTVSQLEADGTLTPITTVVTTEHVFFYRARLEHDPISGRMWVLEGYDSDTDQPAALYQFAADGQLEWMVELSDYERPVDASSLHYHDGSIYVALSMEGVWPSDPSDPNIIYDSLLLERRDLTGAVLWSRGDYAPPNTSELFYSAALIDVSGNALAMVATPPLIDYGPSYPLTVDIETGDVLWSGSDGHDPLRMAVGDAQLYLGWVRPPIDEPTSSSLSVHASSTGVQANLSTVEWPAIDWSSSWGDQYIVLGWMGTQLVSVVSSEGEHGVTIHDEDGTLLCQGALDLEFDAIGGGVGIAGRKQFVAGVRVGQDDSEESGLLLIEPLTDG